jgi:hypothetical protein
MSRRLVHSLFGIAFVALGCAAEEPSGPDAPGAGGGAPAPGGGTEAPPGGGGPEMMGGQTGEGGGEADECSADTWRGPDTPRVTAHCQMLPGTVLGPRYCSCDTRQCPLDADQTPDRACAIEVPFDNLSCEDTLFQVCGVRHDTWCDVSGLSSQRKTCWTQPDGTHLCQCPGSQQLEPSGESVCFMALNTACAGDCQSERGRCRHVPPVGGQSSDLNQFRCECEQGVAGTSPAYFCEDALKVRCSPGCESARGACWKVPDASGQVNTADCLCAGSDQFVHLTESQWDPHGEACVAPLVQVCGE